MVLEQGRIIERGSHDELIAKKGKYYQLYTGNLAENYALSAFSKEPPHRHTAVRRLLFSSPLWTITPCSRYTEP